MEKFDKLYDKPFGEIYMTVSSLIGSVCIGVLIGKGILFLAKTLFMLVVS